MRAVGYARVSSSTQREKETIASQMRVIPEFIARQGWTLAKPIATYVDDGRTAKAGNLDKRAGFSALLRDAAAGLFDVVVVVDVDRLTRSEDLTERGAILGALQRAGVKVASAFSGQVLDLSTSSGDLFTSLFAFFAAEWSRKHRARIMEGKATGASRNRKPGGVLPYGLTWQSEGNIWGIDPERAPIVREVFERVANGESCRAVADDLHKRRVPPRGQAWTRNNVARLIRRRMVLGDWVVSKSRQLRISVPALIDEDLFQRANEALNHSGKQGLARTRYEYLIEALARCGQCGSKINIRSRVWDPRRNGRHQEAAYMCHRRRYFRLDGEGRCGNKIVFVAETDRRVWEAISGELQDPGLAETIGRELAGQAEDRAQWEADAESHRTALSRLERLEIAVLERNRKGLVSDAAMDKELAANRRDRDRIRAQLATAERAQSAALGTQTRLDDAMATLAELREALTDAPFSVRRALVKLLVPDGGITLDGDAIRITMLVPKSSEARGRLGLVAQAESRVLHESYLRIRMVA